MNYNTHTLSNGLRIIHLPSTSPVVYCGYQIQAGSRDELSGEEGLAHFCEHTTFKGTSRRRAWHILNSLESVGGDLQAYTTKESTVYYAAILHDHTARAVDLLTDIVFHSTYPQAELDKEVEVICDEIESYNDTPSELIYDEFENHLFKGHPLGHSILGTAEGVRSFTQADAQRFAHRHYRPDNAIFFAYGDISFSRLVRLLEKAQVGLSAASAIQRPQSAELPHHDILQELHTVIIPKHTHQAHVMLGCRTFCFDDKRRLPLYLLNNILGGPGMNARLNLSLRERNGLVYTVESSMASYHDTGVWSVYFGCDHHDVKRCLRLVHHELDRLMQRPLSQRQLHDAKQQLKGQIAIACDNREQYALDIAKSYLHYGKERDIDLLLQQIDALTTDQLLDVARYTFDSERLQTLIYE